MEFYDVVKTRKSIRKFKSQDIDKEKFLRMIEAAMRAPSWRNQTPYKFIVVERENLKQDIANAIENKSNIAGEAILNSPMTVLVVADPSDSGDVDGKDYYLVDSAIAMEHFILAATAEGYGTCWIGAFDEKKIKESLGIPENLKIVALTPVGIPTDEAEEKPHNPKKDLNDHLYLDKWNESFMDSNVKVLIKD